FRLWGESPRQQGRRLLFWCLAPRAGYRAITLAFGTEIDLLLGSSHKMLDRKVARARMSTQSRHFLAPAGALAFPRLWCQRLCSFLKCFFSTTRIAFRGSSPLDRIRTLTSWINSWGQKKEYKGSGSSSASSYGIRIAR